MTLGGSSINVPSIVRSDTEPGRKVDGMMWINPSGGDAGNNSERYLWNQSGGAWELTQAVGPDTPLNPAVGANWRDTANGVTKSYTGTGWTNVGVTDHGNLDNVTEGQHRTTEKVLEHTSLWSGGFAPGFSG